MATIEFIKKRIEGKEKELDKLEKKLARIRKVEAQNWKEPNPYYYSSYDLEWALKDIERVKKELAKYKEDLVIANEKANSRDVQIIVDFLNNWKINTMDFYKNSFPKYQKALNKFYELNREYVNWRNTEAWKLRHENKLDEIKQIETSYREKEKNFKETWSWYSPYIERRGTQIFFNEDKLQKELNTEADRKYDFIIERTNRIVGQITDASNLYIGNKGDLNGYIIGTKGVAKVQTIGAGGYNIQCYHFRTLINPMR